MEEKKQEKKTEEEKKEAKKEVKQEEVKEIEKKEKEKVCTKNITNSLKYILLGILLYVLLIILTVSLTLHFIFKDGSTVKEYLKESSDKSDNNIELLVTEQEKNVIDIVKQSQESVVSIAVSQIALEQGQGLVDTTNKIGTGFIVDESGIVITNQHVVSDRNSDYKVVNSHGDEFVVTTILRDDISDIALLRIDKGDKELKALKLGDSDKLVVGQNVLAIGTPLGEFAGSVTTGIISGLNRTVSAGQSWFGSTIKTYEGVIQTDAAINPGNSGGPLINSQGEVIGVNFATTQGVDNISFALPINNVKNRLEEYKTHGKFIRPYLGVSYQMISAYEALYYKNVVPGALVVRVEPISPAFVAGIRKGDIITQFGEKKVDRSLAELIQQHKVGEEVEVKVTREGKDQVFKVKLGEME
ncbi:TPA: trypsin-like serine protease [Candidatus Dojkabacteria bacterium]|uniref:Trypsin-like serine protease n=1 Tax=Candidatus Dojkabacteria bacterium TaxID=2099670 RepID=A0A832QCB2_9BACT|nr:trypsin-like serine protease [Candidatus Dojkabacteria bacterium]